MSDKLTPIGEKTVRARSPRGGSFLSWRDEIFLVDPQWVILLSSCCKSYWVGISVGKPARCQHCQKMQPPAAPLSMKSYDSGLEAWAQAVAAYAGVAPLEAILTGVELAKELRAWRKV